MLNEVEWVKVVTDPIGIGGFALFLVFTVLSRTKNIKERRWLTQVFILLAVISLIGGMVIAYVKWSKEQALPIAAPPGVTMNGDIHIETHGAQSPGVGINMGVMSSDMPPGELESEKTEQKDSDAGQ